MPGPSRPKKLKGTALQEMVVATALLTAENIGVPVRPSKVTV